MINENDIFKLDYELPYISICFVFFNLCDEVKIRYVFGVAQVWAKRRLGGDEAGSNIAEQKASETVR